MTRTPILGRVAALAMLMAASGLNSVAPAGASWSAGGSGTASSEADTMPSVAQPSARASGSSVTIQWPDALLPGAVPVAGYLVTRVNATTGAPASVGAGCAGVVAATTCTEVGVPAGSWTYSIVAVQNLWRGSPSAPSTAVGVA
jgi:hypothetical protein